MLDLIKALFNIVAAPVIIIIAIVVMRFTFTTMGIDPEPVMSILIATSPLWLPFLLFYLMFDKWMGFVHLKFEENQGRSTLRLRLPAEVFKSPEAMENVLAQVHNVQSADNLWQTYIDGKHPLNLSLEIVSIGGDVRLYINCPSKKVKNSVEAQMYAQYPGIQVEEEAIDYTNAVTWDPETYDYFTVHMGQKGEQVYPIKTYIDFGMDKLPKEEQKFEPMAAMLEQLATIKPYEHLWVQFICKPHTKKNFKTGYLHAHDSWEHEIQAEIDKIMGRSHDKKGPAELENQPRLTTGERDTIESMERNMGKYAYEVGIRWTYITKKGKFDGNLIAPTIRTFAQYDLIKRNGIGVKWRTDFDYNWFSDWSGKRKTKYKRKELANYKRREYFVRDYPRKSDAPMIMSVEELATIFHIPSSIVMTPGLSRIASTRKEAPPNLPIANYPS